MLVVFFVIWEFLILNSKLALAKTVFLCEDKLPNVTNYHDFNNEPLRNLLTKASQNHEELTLEARKGSNNLKMVTRSDSYVINNLTLPVGDKLPVLGM